MSHEQLVAAINVQLNNVVDNTLPLQLQTMCCKLLMNLVQALAAKPIAMGSDRNLLVRILQTFVAKLGSLRRVQFARVLADTQHSAPSTGGAAAAGGGDDASKVSGEDEGGSGDVDGDGLLLSSSSIATVVIPRGHAPTVCTELDTQRFLHPIPVDQISVAYSDGVKDCRFLLKNMISGLKVCLLLYIYRARAAPFHTHTHTHARARAPCLRCCNAFTWCSTLRVLP
jgi:hypothetical protein